MKKQRKPKIRHSISISDTLDDQLRQKLELSGWQVSFSQFMRILLCKGLNELSIEQEIRGNVNLLHFTSNGEYKPKNYGRDKIYTVVEGRKFLL